MLKSGLVVVNLSCCPLNVVCRSVPPSVIAGVDTVPAKVGLADGALLVKVVCRSAPPSVIASVDTVPVTFKLPVPLSFATSVVPAYHLKAETLVGTLVHIVPGLGYVPIA